LTTGKERPYWPNPNMNFRLNSNHPWRYENIEAITQSMLGMFLRCPHQFERHYIVGEIITPGIAARRGSATHKAAQINHEQKLHTQEDLPLGDLQDAARDSYVTIIKKEGVFIPKDQIAEKDTLLAKGLDAAIRLTTLYRMSLAPAIQPFLVEEKMTMEAGLALLRLSKKLNSPIISFSMFVFIDPAKNTSNRL
jgi:hypothetical protein